MKKHLSNNPQNITPELWYYEENAGINIVHDIIHESKHLRTDQIIIPWRKLKATMHRYNRSRQKGKSK